MTPPSLRSPLEPPLKLSRAAYALVPLLIFDALWLFLALNSVPFRRGPDGVSFGNSFATYLGAARAVQLGRNPYDPRLLQRSERAMLRPQGVPVNQPEWNSHIGSPPIFVWLLQPLTRFPFRTVAWIWIGAMWSIALLGMIVATRALGWSRAAIPALLFSVMPQVFLGAFYGEIYSLGLLSSALSLRFARRHPFLAGLVLALQWFKLLGLVFVPIVVFFHCRSHWRAVLGFSAGTVALFAVSLLTMGTRGLREWMDSLLYYSNNAAINPHLATSIGLYVRWAPGTLSRFLMYGLVAAASVTTVVTFVRTRHRLPLPVEPLAWLWILWFLVLPFGHFYDEILLAIPVLALFTRRGRPAMTTGGVVSLYLLFLSILIYNQTPGGVFLLSVPLIVICGIAARRAWRETSGTLPAPGE